MNAAMERMPAGIRVMSVDDLAAVLAIENSAYDFPWTEGIFEDCFRVGYPSWVYEQDSEVKGYGILSVAAGEGHILNLCVRPDSQHQGIGKLLLEALLLTAEILDVSALFLEVRVSNKSAIHLYEKLGFNEVGLRQNYYPAKKGREDAVVLAKQLV
ncbi:MAG TPA: ribosomal-protein-alanine N-acetyltransferase [Gammaproteobacteria bacterium]|jgi:ribosomal-protein-alanine N-acetyltransferase|nr:ribosomal-protein-alanine N-acetyltransferase [Gammaproteobacteria bacterium]